MGGCPSTNGEDCPKISRETVEKCLEPDSSSQSDCCMPSVETPPSHITPVDPWGPMSENEYVQYIRYAKYRSDQRFRANGCPKAKLDDFEVISCLGRGAFGAVYLVKSLQNGTEYALKLQIKENLKTNDLGVDVVREKKLHYAVRHRFIARLFYAFQDSKNLYMVMERAEYGDLSRLSGLEEDTIKSIVAQVILAFEYLHACSIIHRDLKRENVLLAEDCYVKLVDFGIAKRIRGRTSSFIGCMPYLSPEHHLSLAYGRDFDFWLLGHFVFELSYDERAFYQPGWTEEECREAVLKTEVPFPSEVDENSARNRLIKALLQKKRSKRLGTLRGGINDVKKHEWFSDIDFLTVFNKVERMDLSVEPMLLEPLDGFDDIRGTPLTKPKKFREF